MALKVPKRARIQTLFLVIGLISAVFMVRSHADAACSVDTSRGTVTQTFSVPADGSYKFWARMGATSANNDSFYVEIDGGTCILVGDTAVPTTGWKWVDYKNGNTGDKTAGVQLTAGTHTLKMTGREDSVKVDRVLFLSDTCVPDDASKGDNCVNSDTTLPSVTLTSPANGATITGTNTALQATATDDVGVTKVEFYMDGNLLGSDTSSPYSFGLNTTLYTNGTHNIWAQAYDAAGNTRSTAQNSITINNPVPDTTNPQVSITSPLNNSSVSGTINVTASASDNVGVTKVEVFVDSVLKATLTSSPYTYQLDTTTLTNNAQHTIMVKAYDAVPLTAQATATVTVNQVVTPPPGKTGDFNNDGKVNINDLSILLTNYGKTVTVKTNGDCNGDGKVDVVDLAMLLSNYGT